MKLCSECGKPLTPKQEQDGNSTCSRDCGFKRGSKTTREGYRYTSEHEENSGDDD